jgi:hypothetical protein
MEEQPMRFRSSGPVIVLVAAITSPMALNAQVVDKGCSGTVADRDCSGGGARSGRTRTVEGPPPRPGAVSSVARRDAVDLNNRAVEVMNDWNRLDEARQLLERAVALDPSDSTIAGNLQDVRNSISMKKSRAQATTSRVENVLARLANSLATADGSTTSSHSGLQFGSATIVDARAVASGLPAGTDRAIAAVYGNAPAGVADRVRKGFQAVMVHDWKVARAWFEDALLRDPQNAGLKRLIAAVNQPPPTPQLTARPPSPLDGDPLGFLLEGIEQSFIDDLDALIGRPQQ